jgi:hypothetical protein
VSQIPCAEPSSASKEVLSLTRLFGTLCGPVWESVVPLFLVKYLAFRVLFSSREVTKKEEVMATAMAVVVNKEEEGVML